MACVTEKEGYEAFKDYQVEHCDDPLQPGVAFPFVKRLIGLNAFFPDLEPFRVVALSRNSPVTARRFFNSCRHYNLPIDAGAFTSDPAFDQEEQVLQGGQLQWHVSRSGHWQTEITTP